MASAMFQLRRGDDRPDPGRLPGAPVHGPGLPRLRRARRVARRRAGRAHAARRATTRPTCCSSSWTSSPRRWSRATAPGSCRSSRPRPPRPRCSSTCSSPARRSTAPRGSRRPASSWPRTRRSACWRRRPASPRRRAAASWRAARPATSRRSWWPATRRRTGARPTAPQRPLVAMSEDAHSSVGKALHVLGVGALTVPALDHRLTGPALRAALRDDPRRATSSAWSPRRERPTPASSTTSTAWPTWPPSTRCGSTSTAPTAARRRSSRRRCAISSPASSGPTRSSSIPHKWLFAPFDCAALVYRQPNLAKAVHTQDAQYLEVLHSENPEEWNPSDYAFHLTRRARGLPLWFSMAVNGLDAYRDAVEAGLAMAQRAAERIVRGTPRRAGARPRALHRAVPAAGMDQGRLRRLVGPPAPRPDRLRHPDELGGRDGGPLRLPPPEHHGGDGRRDPRLNGRDVTRRGAARSPASRRPGRPGMGQAPLMRK